MRLPEHSDVQDGWAGGMDGHAEFMRGGAWGDALNNAPGSTRGRLHVGRNFVCSRAELDSGKETEGVNDGFTGSAYRNEVVLGLGLYRDLGVELCGWYVAGDLQAVGYLVGGPSSDPKARARAYNYLVVCGRQSGNRRCTGSGRGNAAFRAYLRRTRMVVVLEGLSLV